MRNVAEGLRGRRWNPFFQSHEIELSQNFLFNSTWREIIPFFSICFVYVPLPGFFEVYLTDLVIMIKPVVTMGNDDNFGLFDADTPEALGKGTWFPFSSSLLSKQVIQRTWPRG